MCGIAGIIGCEDVSAMRRRAEKMRSALAHRGRDGDGMWCGADSIMVHNRLAVIGLENGEQPLTNEDGNIVCVCNGEVYNFRELRASLEGRGHVFSSASDSEVIAHLYEEHPDDFPSRLNGMFAFALLDLRRRKLLLCRDRLGQKPLFFKRTGNEVAFAGELGALAADGENVPDPAAVAEFFERQYIAPPRTIYGNIRSVCPGTMVSFDLTAGAFTAERYWKLDFSSECDLDLPAAAAELGRLLGDAVERRLMSEVPLGGFLSGGLDSAVIAALMLERGKGEVDFCSVTFDDPAYDESGNVEKTVDFLKRRHPGRVNCRRVKAECGDFEQLVEVAGFFGQPFADGSMLPCFELSRAAKKSGLTVTLSGDGADELFGGYERYTALTLAGKFGAFPGVFRLARLLPGGGERTFFGRVKRFSAAASAPESVRYDLLTSAVTPTMRAAFGKKLRAAWTEPAMEFTARSPEGRAAEKDVHTYLPGDVLTKVDICSMRSAQEVRSPFLDWRVAEFAARLPWSFKQRGLERKRIVREAFADRVHPDVLNGGKRGFGIPTGRLLAGAWREKAMALTLAGAAVEGGFFTPEGVDELWKRHLSGKSDEAKPLFSLLIFELFLRSQNCQM